MVTRYRNFVIQAATLSCFPGALGSVVRTAVGNVVTVTGGSTGINGDSASATTSGSNSERATAIGGNGVPDPTTGTIGGSGGGADATATAVGNSTGYTGAQAWAYATSGAGGDAPFGNPGLPGTGSVEIDAATATATSDYGGAVTAAANAVAGFGGGTTGGGAFNAYCVGAPGMEASLSNRATGYSTGGTVALTQNSFGGGGGSSVNASGGSGGDATSTENISASHGESYFNISVDAEAGSGGSGGGPPPGPFPTPADPGSGGAGGDASANIVLNALSAMPLLVVAQSAGGDAGTGIEGSLATAGHSTTTVAATASAGGDVDASGSALGGAGASNISSYSGVVGGGNFANKDGGSGAFGEATVTAATLSGDASATAHAQGGAGSETAGSGTTPGNGGGATAIAYAFTASGTATASAVADSGNPGGGPVAGSLGSLSVTAIAIAGPVRSVGVTTYPETGRYEADAYATTTLSSSSMSGSDLMIGDQSSYSAVLPTSGTFTQSGSGTVSFSNSIAVQSGSTYILTGGSVTTPSLVNNGTLNYSGGSITANITNNGIFRLRGGSPLTIDGDVTNGSLSAFSSTVGTSITVTGTLTSSSSSVSTIDGLTANALVINSGRFIIRDDATLADRPNTVNSLSVDTSGTTAIGTLDLTNNALTIHYGSGADPVSGIRSLLVTGYDSATWNGPGITSATAYNENQSGLVTALGYSDDGAGNIKIAYTLGGDANLDGSVDGIDFGILAANYGMTTGATWQEGDFNYDGSVDFSDFSILTDNYGGDISVTPDSVFEGENPIEVEFAPLLSFAQTIGDAPAIEAIIADRESAAATAVPEPASVELLCIGAIGILARRRRVHHC